MSTDAEPEPPYRPPLAFKLSMLVWPVAIVLVALAAYVYQRAPRRAAHAFVNALRHGDRASALALGTPEFRSAVAAGFLHAEHPDPRDATEPALARLAASTDATFSNFALGFGVACMEGSLDIAGRDEDVYVDLRNDDGEWHVNGVSLVREVGFCGDD